MYSYKIPTTKQQLWKAGQHLFPKKLRDFSLEMLAMLVLACTILAFHNFNFIKDVQIYVPVEFPRYSKFMMGKK